MHPAAYKLTVLARWRSIQVFVKPQKEEQSGKKAATTG